MGVRCPTLAPRGAPSTAAGRHQPTNRSPARTASPGSSGSPATVASPRKMAGSAVGAVDRDGAKSRSDLPDLRHAGRQILRHLRDHVLLPVAGRHDLHHQPRHPVPDVHPLAKFRGWGLARDGLSIEDDHVDSHRGLPPGQHDPRSPRWRPPPPGRCSSSQTRSLVPMRFSQTEWGKLRTVICSSQTSPSISQRSSAGSSGRRRNSAAVIRTPVRADAVSSDSVRVGGVDLRTGAAVRGGGVAVAVMSQW